MKAPQIFGKALETPRRAISRAWAWFRLRVLRRRPTVAQEVKAAAIRNDRLPPQWIPFLPKAIENRTRAKVYLAASMTVPESSTGAWRAFSEPVLVPGYARIPIRPFRFQELPETVDGLPVVAWAIFERAKGGEPVHVWIKGLPSNPGASPL